MSRRFPVNPWPRRCAKFVRGGVNVLRGTHPPKRPRLTCLTSNFPDLGLLVLDDTASVASWSKAATVRQENAVATVASGGTAGARRSASGPEAVVPRSAEDSDRASNTASDPAPRTDTCTDECTSSGRVL